MEESDKPRPYLLQSHVVLATAPLFEIWPIDISLGNSLNSQGILSGENPGIFLKNIWTTFINQKFI